MKINALISVAILFALFSCSFLQEIYEPRDLLLLVKIYSDIYAPSVNVLSPTNGQQVATTYQIIGNAVDNGAKTVTAGMDKVYISIDGKPPVGCNVKNGGWQAIFSNCVEGWHTNTYYALDKLSNSSPTNRLVVYVQALIPTFLISTPASGILTNKEYILFSGTAKIGKPYSIESVFIESADGSIREDIFYKAQTESWKIMQKINEGTNHLYLRAIGSSGLTNSVYCRIVCDFHIPVLSIGVLPTATNSNSIMIRGTASDSGIGLQSVWVKMNNNAYQLQTGKTNWSFATVLSNGPNTFSAYAVDIAGNFSMTNVSIIVFDSNIPSIGINPLPAYTNKSSVTVSGTASFVYGISKVYVKIGNGSFSEATGTGSWSKDLTLTTGSNYIYAYCINNSGTPSGLVSLLTVFDTTAPTVSITKPAMNISINSNSYRLEGTASDSGSGVKEVCMKVDGGSFFKLIGTTNWQTNLKVYSGTHTVYVYSKDFTGNSSQTNSIQITDTLSGTKSITSFSMEAGVLWTPRLNDSSRSWWGIASSADGTKVVAVASGGYIYTSTDSGATWTARMTDVQRGWRFVASSTNGTRLVAVAQNNYIYTSADSGVTWTNRYISTNWRSVASSADGSKLFTANQSGLLYTSTDYGVTWTPRNSVRAWLNVASSADGTKLVAVAQTDYIYTSDNSGATWTTRKNDQTRYWHCVSSSSDGTKLVAVTYGSYLYTSTDAGVNWTQRLGTANRLSVASSANGQTVLYGVEGGYLYMSTNYGVDWRLLDLSGSWRCIAMSSDGKKLFAGNQTSYLYTSSAVTGVIDEGNHTIAVTMPKGTALTSLVFKFITTGVSVKVGTITQVSGITATGFSTGPLTYTVTAADGTTQDYIVTVSAP